jgi:hypothetical protein
MWTRDQILSLVQADMPEISAERVLEYTSRAYLDLINQDCSQMIFYSDNIDYPVPILRTVEGQSRYLLDENNLIEGYDNAGDEIAFSGLIDQTPVTIRKARRLFIEGYESGLPHYIPSGYPVSGEWMRSNFYEIPCQIIPQRGENPGSVSIFNNYEKDIFVEAYYTPQNLIDNVSAEFLLDTDLWLDAIIDGAVGYYEKSAYGKSERLVTFLKYHKPKFKSEGSFDQEFLNSNQFPTRMV